MALDGWRAPPVNLFAEQALLGALLANCKAFDRVADVLRAEYFSNGYLGEIYSAIAQYVNAGRQVDAVILATHFGDREVLFADGNSAPLKNLLADCLASMVGILNVREYALAIVEAWHRRQLIDIGTQLVNEAYAPGEGADPAAAPVTARDVHEAAEGRLYAAAAMLTDAGETVEAHEAVRMAIDEAEKASKQRGGLVGITTGLEELDSLLGGLRKSDLVLLGARPSMGKTALALAIGDGAARAGHTVLFETLEMNATQLGKRMVAGKAGLPGDYADRGLRQDRDSMGRFVYSDLDQADWQAMVAVQRSMSDIKAYPLVIDECRQRTIGSIRTRARQMQRKRGLGLVVIDYLGLLRVPELARAANRVLEVSRISADAKALAVELGVPVLLLSQLNRALEGREDRRPRLSDLRDSGSLEQDADIVMFLHREHFYLQREPVKRRANESDDKLAERQAAWLTAVHEAKGRASVHVEKYRMGRVGSVGLAFDDRNGWISDLPHEGRV